MIIDDLLNREEALSNYIKLNQSFRRTLVFRMGDSGGFFSEYSGMILAMLYCLTHQTRFILHSYKGNFAREKGWEDFFLPFCTIIQDKPDVYVHTYTNFRPFGLHGKIQMQDGVWKWQLKKRVLNVLARGYNLFYPRTYLTQDLWDQFFYSQPHYDIPELGINGNIVQACHRLAQMTWHFNGKTGEEIQVLEEGLKLPQRYVSCHIRGGDKFMETKLLTIDPYMERIKEQPYKDIFVLTDDYTVIDQLATQYPTYKWYTLCEETERGYFHQNFSKSDRELKYRSLLKLLASVDIMARSQRFIGTTTSNPSIFMDICRPDISESVDGDKNMLYYLLYPETRLRSSPPYRT